MGKTYTSEFKTKVALELLREEQTPAEIAGKYGIHPNQLARWKRTAIEGMPESLGDKRKKESDLKEQEELIRELYAQIGELSSTETLINSKGVSKF